MTFLAIQIKFICDQTIIDILKNKKTRNGIIAKAKSKRIHQFPEKRKHQKILPRLQPRD